MKHLTIDIPERILCTLKLHDYSRWRKERKYIVTEKIRHCKRGKCAHSEVTYCE